ncbi:TonB-dependent receptor [Phenylobacterium sp.]|uniref:TonB-dependent receptor n=1 Tax=Phenylobacterium sp. TaxID=1871053 RepID=UPI0039839E0E
MSFDDGMRVRGLASSRWALAGASACALIASAGSAWAQAPSTVEEVVVTGSYIQRPVNDTPNPVSVLGNEELAKQSIQTADYLFKNLPMANGARSTPDNTNAPYQLGMANINLRGLGVASTLTLINGRRQVVSPVPLDDGSSFVDINVIPLIMIDRVEILQSGGSGLYGSDAIAGVANFVMRRSFEGVEVRAQYQSTFKDSQEDFNLGVVGGTSGDNWDFVAGIEGLYRTPLAQNDRPFTRNRIRSALGFPGAYRPIGAALPVIDPACAQLGGIPTPFVPGTNLGLCGLDLSRAFWLIAPEQRILGYATGNYRLNERHTLYAELGLAHNEAKLRSAPSYSNLTFPTIPANNPGNLVVNGGFGVPVTLFGRPLGFVNYPANEQRRRSDQLRLVGGFKGQAFPGWTYDASYTYALQNYSPTNIRDTVKDRFIAALNGVGGPNNNQFYNPFGSALTNPALANDPRVIADFTRDSWRKYYGGMHSVEAIITGDLWDMPAGKVGAAFGVQFRHETLEFKSDRDQQTGNFVFLFSGPDFEMDRDVGAVFGELAVPIAENFDLQLQARYDSYSGGIGGSFNPQAAIRWEPLDTVVLRASAGTSFRAPSLSQISSISTINNAVVDPFNPSLIPFFSQILSLPGSDLDPETAKNYGVGVLWTPNSNWNFTVDYWRYDYKDLIVKENFQAIVTANPNDPRITRQGGTPRGLIQQVRVAFVNQNAVVSDGVDFSGTLRESFDAGDMNITVRGTYLNKYETTVGGRKRDISGFRNTENFARSLPKLRFNVIATFERGPQAFTATVNHTSSYKENFTLATNPLNGFKYNDFWTLDLQYALALDQWDTNLTVGVINITDEYPPNSRIASDLQGFDRFVYDPRGALGYVRLAKRF